MSAIRLSRFAIVLGITLLSVALSALAQTGAAPSPEKLRVLRPPQGSPVAVLVFADLQCPDCARAKPIIKQAAETTGVPVVHHDFPLPQHNWSFDAAVIGRYFESVSPKLGEAWRDYAYANQPSLTPQNLKEHAQRFAQANGQQLPFIVDPGGKFAAEVRADYQLGQRIGIQHTPTIFVVSARKSGAPFVEDVDRNQLVQIINDMKQQAAAEKPAAPARKSGAKRSAGGARKPAAKQ